MRSFLMLLVLFVWCAAGMYGCKGSDGIACPGFREKTASRQSNHPTLSKLKQGNSGVRRTRAVYMRSR